MVQWDDGYVSDVVYTSNFYREITPNWLAMTSLLLGHRPPDLAKPFGYADVGCGNGITALVVAATCPHADVWGFDFNPAHVEFASRLAARAGLTNVRFVESSFADLDAMSDAELPDFDVIVSHGVVSWISPTNRSHLVGVIAKRLKPGGLVYLSYNVMTGWAAMVPVQALMQMLATASPERSDAALPGVLDFIDRLKEAGALYFQAHPTLEDRLPRIRKDPIYSAHEYLNQQWRPLMFADLAVEMLEAKCRFIGSATLAENIDTVAVPPNMAPILGETRDPYLRETLRDIGCAQAFRRDLFRKGISPMLAAEQQGLAEGLTLAGFGQQPVPEGGITFATPIGNVTGRPEVYQPLLSLLEAGPLSVRQANQSPAFVGRPLMELMQAFTLLVAGGYAHPMLPEEAAEAGRATSRRLNLAIAQANADAAGLAWIAAPAIGSAVPGDPMDTLLLGELLAGKPAEVASLARELVRLLNRSGRSFRRDGEPVTDPAQTMRAVTELVVGMLEKRVPVLQQLGVMGD